MIKISSPPIICNKIATLFKMNVPSCRINFPRSQIIDPPSQINVPHCQINVPLSNKFPKFLRQSHDSREIYLQEGHTFVSLIDHVYGPLVQALSGQRAALQVDLSKILISQIKKRKGRV